MGPYNLTKIIIVKKSKVIQIQLYYLTFFLMIESRKKANKHNKLVLFTLSKELNEISDTRVLCSFINSFVPNLFPTEILMNDK